MVDKLKMVFAYRNNFSILTKLIIGFSFSILIPLLFVGSISYVYFKNSAENKAIRTFPQIIDQLNQSIELYVEELDRLSLMPYYDDKVMAVLQSYGNAEEYGENSLQNQRTVEDFLSNFFILPRRDIVGIYLFLNNRKTYYSTKGYNIVKRDFRYTDASWYKQLQGAEGGKLLIGNNDQEYITNPRFKVFSLSRSIVDYYSKKEVGVILIDVNMDELARLSSSINFGKQGGLFILDHYGSLVYQNGYPVMEPGLLKLFSKQKDTLIETVKGDKMLVSYVKSRYSGWTVVSVVSIKELIKDVNLIRNTTIFTSVIGLIIGLISAVSIAYGITKPLKSLRKVMRKIECGDLKVRFKATTGDEVGQLGVNFNNMLEKINDLINREYKARIQKKESDLKVLQGQINPHFIYNTLEMINMTAQIHDDEEVSEMVSALGDLIRTSTKQKGDIISIRQEIDYIKNYIYILKMRYRELLTVDLYVDERLLDYQTLKLILQPIIENAIYHGFKNKEEGWLIRVRVYQLKECIIFEVTDNGAGMEKSRVRELKEEMMGEGTDWERTSIGIINVHRRIRFQYGEPYGLKVISKSGLGMRAKMVIPALFYLPAKTVDKL